MELVKIGNIELTEEEAQKIYSEGRRKVIMGAFRHKPDTLENGGLEHEI